MMEKSLTEQFDRHYAAVLQNIARAAIKSGRKPEEITLLAAVKTVDPELINYSISKGITVIGDNRVQELVQKESLLTPGVEKHFIGHLQTNKIKDVVGRVEMIESVDSLRVATGISERSQKLGLVTQICIEVNIGGELNKSGFSPDMVEEEVEKIAVLPGVQVVGLMCVPPICDNHEKLRSYFSKMYKLFLDIKAKKIDNVNMRVLSMGMSSDYETAIECGATQVRIGSLLYGARHYT